jgi:hypothetical protein
LKIDPAVFIKMSTGHMAFHAAWHAARIPKSLVSFHDRNTLDAVRQHFPGVVDWNAHEAGRQFLEFHREMIRHYKFIRLQVLGSEHFPVWDAFPLELERRLPRVYVEAFVTRIEQLVRGDSVEDLGNFIEAAGRCNELGSNIHNFGHGHLALIEAERYPGHADLKVVGMDDPATAHYNELFWKFHGWLDSLYSRWLRGHGMLDDTSPLDPSRGRVHPRDSKIPLSLAVILRARFNP